MKRWESITQTKEVTHAIETTHPKLLDALREGKTENLQLLDNVVNTLLLTSKANGKSPSER